MQSHVTESVRKVDLGSIVYVALCMLCGEMGTYTYFLSHSLCFCTPLYKLLKDLIYVHNYSIKLHCLCIDVVFKFSFFSKFIKVITKDNLLKNTRYWKNGNLFTAPIMSGLLLVVLSFGSGVIFIFSMLTNLDYPYCKQPVTNMGVRASSCLGRHCIGFPDSLHITLYTTLDALL